MGIEQDDVIRIFKMMDESDYDELHLEMGDLKLTIAKSGTQGHAPAREQSPISPTEPTQSSVASPVVADKPSSEKDLPADETIHQKEAPKPDPVASDGLIPVTSPLLGTFYQGPKPEAPPFVEIGSRVKKDDTVCLIEVMKTFTTIKAGVDGRIALVCVKNSQMVEFEQTIFLIEPDTGSEKQSDL